MWRPLDILTTSHAGSLVMRVVLTKEGLKVMMDEIEFLSKGDLDDGNIQVSVFEGYTDER